MNAYQNLPPEIKALKQWCVARIDKIPLNPLTGKAASVSNSSTWGTFEQAVAANMPYIGFVLAEDDPYCVIDLDDKPDKPASPEEIKRYHKMINTFDSYTERSSGGREGYHIVIKGKVPRGARRDHVEVYSQSRFMIFTGNVINSKPIAERQELLDVLYNELTSNNRLISSQVIDGPEVKSDDDIFQMAANAKNADKFIKLCEGEWEGDYPSPSEADFALLSMLVRRSQNNAQVKRMFRKTKLGERDKATKDDEYLDRSIANLRRALGWPLPTPLPDALPPVQPFNPDLKPDALRGWVMDIADRMQCPPDFPAVGAIAAVSSLIGARAVVQPKAHDDWQVVPNLWGLIVGRPGVMKSPALAQVLKPLHRLQVEENKRYQAERKTWELDCKLAQLQAADREKKAKGLASKDPAKARALLTQKGDASEPMARLYIVNNATVEKLGELLAVNPWGLLVYRDELYGQLTSLDKQGQEDARTFYLQGYDGNQGYTFQRIVRGTTHIPRVCLAMIGGIQPGRLQQYVRAAVAGGSGDDGLLQRFGLAVWPDVTKKFINVDRWPDSQAKQQAWEVFERLAQLQPASETEPQVWRFDSAAQALFDQWRTTLEEELRQGELHPALESHLAKYRKLIPALALIFALVDTPDTGVIGEHELRRAFAWGEYLRSHAERIYSAATTPETGAASVLLRKIKAGALGAAFTPREVAQKGWAGLNSPDAVRKAADVLIEYDWLRREVIESGAHGGRPSARYIVNPSAMQGKDGRSDLP